MMEHYFCGGDLDCWYAWFWSSATAAWLQAIFSCSAIVVTITLWRTDKRKSKEIEREEALVNLYTAYGAFSLAEKAIRQLIDSGHGGVPPHQQATTCARILERMQAHLDSSIHKRLPSHGLQGYAQGALAGFEMHIVYMYELAQLLKENGNSGPEAKVAPEKKEEINRQLENYCQFYKWSAGTFDRIRARFEEGKDISSDSLLEHD